MPGSGARKNKISETGDGIFRRKEKGGTIPEHILVDGKYQSSWKIYVDTPGNMKFDISYSFKGKKPRGSITVNAVDSNLKHVIKPTGMTVGEPNQNWFFSLLVRNHRPG